VSGSGRAVWINNSVKKKKAHIIKRGYRNRISSFFAKDGENRRERMKKISAYYRIIQNLTCMGFFFTLIFAVKSFENAVPDEIYVRAGETVSYDFDVPVSVVLKQDSTEVFEYLTKDSPLTYCVNCRLFGIFPVKDITVMLVEPETVYASGMPVGIYAKTKGVLVIGNGEVERVDGREVKPSENLVKSGDYIVSVNGMAVSEKEDLAAAVNEAGGGKDILGIMRGEEYIEVSLDPVKSVSGKYMLGVWVRDDLAGVGTLTYYKADGTYAALGHASTQRPQLIHAVCNFSAAATSSCDIHNREDDVFVVGTSNPNMANPIIGPPEIIFSGCTGFSQVPSASFVRTM
jgi:stage IV sporulation protein B